MTGDRRSERPAGWWILLGLAISHAGALEPSVPAERGFQRRCAELAHAPALPEIDGDPWFNASLFGFKPWRPYRLSLESLKGRVVVLAFLDGTSDGAIRSMGRWWLKTKRDDMMLIAVCPGGTLAGGLAMVQTSKIPFPLAVDGNRLTADAYGLRESWPKGPVVFVVQRDGSLGAVVYGEFYESRLDLAIARVWIGRDTTLAENVRVPDDFLRTISPVRNGTLERKITFQSRGMTVQEVLLSLFRKAKLDLLVDLPAYDPPVFFGCRDISLREALYLLAQEYALRFEWTPSWKMPAAVLVGRAVETR